MVPFYGDFDTTETVYLPFNTFDSNDPSASATITNLANTDIHIHKDGSTTQRSSAAGVTVSIDFDTITGNHMVSIDLSDNTDAGYYANGSQYSVRMEGTTVDGATINAWIGSFSIGRTLRPTTAGRTLDVAATGEAGVDLGNVTGTLTQANVGWVDANSRVDVGSVGGQTASATGAVDFDDLAAILLDTADIQPNYATAAELAKVPKSDGTTSWNATALAAINAEVDTAIETYGLDHLVSAAVIGTDVADNSIIAKLAASGATADWDTYVNTTDSLQAVRDHIGDGTNLTEAGGDGDHLTAVPWNAAWDAEVQSEVDDALKALTLTQSTYAPQEAPPVNATLPEVLAYLYKAWRNKSDQDATTYQLYADNGSTVDQKATVSDDGTTATKGEVGSGP